MSSAVTPVNFKSTEAPLGSAMGSAYAEAANAAKLAPTSAVLTDEMRRMVFPFGVRPASTRVPAGLNHPSKSTFRARCIKCLIIHGFPSNEGKIINVKVKFIDDFEVSKRIFILFNSMSGFFV